MPPKGAKKPPSCLGAVHLHHNGWRVNTIINSRTVHGPWRLQKRDADADLAYARSTQTQEEYCSILEQLKNTVYWSSLKKRDYDAHPTPLIESSDSHAQSNKTLLVPSSSSGVKQPAARSKHENSSQAPSSPSIAASPSSGSSITQPAPTSRVAEGGVNKPAAIESSNSGVAQSAAAKQCPSHARRVLNTENSGDKQPAASCQELRSTTMLLQLKRPHYDAIKDRRRLWEARPLVDGSSRRAVVGNSAVLQSGAGTNDRVCIAEVRRYLPQGLYSHPLDDMVAELGADLLPDVADTKGRKQVYESLYGSERCARGFVAMRFEWPDTAVVANSQAKRRSTTTATTSSASAISQLVGPSAGKMLPQANTRRTCEHEYGCGKLACNTCFPFD